MNNGEIKNLSLLIDTIDTSIIFVLYGFNTNKNRNNIGKYIKKLKSNGKNPLIENYKRLQILINQVNTDILSKSYRATELLGLLISFSALDNFKNENKIMMTTGLKRTKVVLSTAMLQLMPDEEQLFAKIIEIIDKILLIKDEYLKSSRLSVLDADPSLNDKSSRKYLCSNCKTVTDLAIRCKHCDIYYSCEKCAKNAMVNHQLNDCKKEKRNVLNKVQLHRWLMLEKDKIHEKFEKDRILNIIIEDSIRFTMSGITDGDNVKLTNKEDKDAIKNIDWEPFDRNDNMPLMILSDGIFYKLIL